MNCWSSSESSSESESLPDKWNNLVPVEKKPKGNKLFCLMSSKIRGAEQSKLSEPPVQTEESLEGFPDK